MDAWKARSLAVHDILESSTYASYQNQHRNKVRIVDSLERNARQSDRKSQNVHSDAQSLFNFRADQTKTLRSDCFLRRIPGIGLLSLQTRLDILSFHCLAQVLRVPRAESSEAARVRLWLLGIQETPSTLLDCFWTAKRETFTMSLDGKAMHVSGVSQ